MDVTDNYQIPYPECDPPLTKDASDIEQMRDLAERVDEVVQDYADAILADVVMPDAARLFISPSVTTTDADVVFFLDSITFDNTTGNAMSDLTNGVIRILRDGWYGLGAWIEAAVATDIQLRVRFIANGDPVTNFHGLGSLAQAGENHVNAEEVVFLRAGDGVTVQTRHGFPGTSVQYAVRVWALLVAAND